MIECHSNKTMKIYIVIIYILSQIYRLADALIVDYCELPCHINNKTVEHIICTLKNDCSVGPECKVRRKFNYSQDLRNFTLDMHNYFRNKTAYGEAFGQNAVHLPTATDMLEMVWDEELAYFAQCYANKCILQYDKCRQSSAGENIGQLIFIRVSVNPKTEEEIITEMLEYVFHSSKAMTFADVGKYKDNKYIRQFTQLVWSRTNRVGCGMTKLLEDLDAFFMVCNYGSAGNVEGENVYNIGLTCSSCPDERRCGTTEFSGLCAATEYERRISREKTEIIRVLGLLDGKNPEMYELQTMQISTDIASTLEGDEDMNISENLITSTSTRVVEISDTSTFESFYEDEITKQNFQGIKDFPKDKTMVLLGRLISETALQTTSAIDYKEVPMKKCMVKRKYSWPDFGHQDNGAQVKQISLYLISMYMIIVKMY